jgi:hypothetical protein
MGSDHAERVELPLTPGWLGRGIRDEDGGGDRSGGVGGGCGGHGLPNRAGDFQGMVSGATASWISMCRPGGSSWSSTLTGRLPSTAVRRATPGTPVTTSAGAPTGPRMEPVPVTGGALRAAGASGADLMALAAVRDSMPVSEAAWRSVTRRSAVIVARPSRSAAALSSALLNWSAVWGSGCPRDAVKAASILSGPGGSALAGGRTAGSDADSSGADPIRRDSSRTPGISAAARPRARTAACSVIHVPSSGPPSGSSWPRSSWRRPARVHASVSTGLSPSSLHLSLPRPRFPAVTGKLIGVRASPRGAWRGHCCRPARREIASQVAREALSRFTESVGHAPPGRWTPRVTTFVRRSPERIRGRREHLPGGEKRQAVGVDALCPPPDSNPPQDSKPRHPLWGGGIETLIGDVRSCRVLLLSAQVRSARHDA